MTTETVTDLQTREIPALQAVKVPIAWQPDLSIYASEQFLKTAGDEYGWVGGVDAKAKVRCILPYTIIRKATVRMVRFRVETIPLVENFSIEEEKSFLNSAVGFFRSIGGDLIIPGTTNAIFRTYPDGATAAPYGTHIVDLTQPEDILWQKVHSKHKNVIRNATKKGVRVITGPEHTQTAYNLIRETFKRSTMPFMEWAAFQKMVVGLGEQVKVFIAEHEGAIQGCAVIPFSQHGAYYVYGGTAGEPLTGASNFLQWEAIRYFRSLGVKRYDFCGARINPEKGSKQAGLIMYKERFGPQFVRGFMWKRPLGPLKSAVYSLAVRMMRGGDIVDSEHHKLEEAGVPQEVVEELND